MTLLHLCLRHQMPVALDQLIGQHPQHATWAAIVEGWIALPEHWSGIDIHMISGCACCTGQLAMKVTLARILRGTRPDHLAIAVNDGAHLERVRALLADPQYRPHLTFPDFPATPA